MGVRIDKIEFTSDRIAHSNYLFGTVKEETTKTFEPGAVFLFSPPGTLKDIAGLNTEVGGSDTANIEKREERVSWDVSLDTSSVPLKKGDIESIEPVAFSGEQLQKYLTRLPGGTASAATLPLAIASCTVVTACTGKTLDQGELYRRDTCKISLEDPSYPNVLYLRGSQICQ